MFHKPIFLLIPMMMVAFAMSKPAYAEEEFEGTIVHAMESQLVLHDMRTGEYHNIIVEPETRIALDGKEVRLVDLMPNFHVFVVAQSDGSTLFAKQIEATTQYDLQPESAPNLYVTK
jgi:hypothetical protein